MNLEKCDTVREEASLWTVYILLCSDKTLYCGITNNLPRRLEQHNGTKPNGAKRTKGRGPFEVVFQLQKLESRSVAQKLEYQIKKLSRIDKEKLIQGDKKVLDKTLSCL